MKLVAPVLALTLLVASAVPALACSPPPGEQGDNWGQDVRTATSVYEARIEDVVPRDAYGESVDFTVRPTAAIWGPVSPEPFRLSFESGACSNWLFLTADSAERPPVNGTKVIVMMTPKSAADRHWLYILGADADYLDDFMREWRAAHPERTAQ